MILAAACTQRGVTLHVLVLGISALEGNYDLTLDHAAGFYCVLTSDTPACHLRNRYPRSKFVRLPIPQGYVARSQRLHCLTSLTPITTFDIVDCVWLLSSCAMLSEMEVALFQAS